MGYETDHGQRRGDCAEADHGQRRGQGATPAAFYLGLCRLRGILSPPASATVILQAEPFFVAATGIRIGRRSLLRRGQSPRSFCRRVILSLMQRKLDSDAKDHSRYGRSRRNYSPLRRRKFESDAAGRCHNERCRRNYSSLRQRKLESDAEPRAATAVAGGPFFFDATKIRIGRECSLLQQTLQAEPCSDSQVWA